MNIKKITSVLLSASMLGANAFAAHEIKSDPVNETIIIKGSIDDGASVGAVSVNILKLGKTISELEEVTYDIIAGDATADSLQDIIAYSIQAPVKGDKSFEVIAPINGDSGIYTVFVDYAGNTNKKGVEFAFVKHDDNVAAIEKLINAKSESEAVEVMDEEWILLDFHNDLYEQIDKDYTAIVYYNLLKETSFEKEDVESAKLYFDRACNIQAIEEGKGNISETVELLGIEENNDLYPYLKVERKNVMSEVADNMKDIDILNLKEYKEALTEAVILAFVNYPDGTGEVKDIFKDFSDVIGISNPTSSNSVYSKLAGNKYDDIADLKAAYNKALKDNSSNQGTGGGGSGGGSKSSNSVINASTVGIAGIEVDPEPINEVKEEVVEFDDLDTVAWAKDAVMALHQRGIVSGKGENKFAPNDPVTREQFVTMLVNAFELKGNDESVVFDDVKADDWFADYVKIAAQNGIVKGTGTGFGTGKQITRQDMAVMVMNTVTAMNLELAPTKEAVEFADEQEISQYATEAVKTLSLAGIINGMGDGAFNPKGVNTRAQAAVVIYAVLVALGK